MSRIIRATEMVRRLIPDLDEQISQFEVESVEADEELVAAFCWELDRLCSDLKAGLASFDEDRVRFSAHSIKGMAGTMGLPEISVLAREIEHALHTKEKERCRMLGSALIRWAEEQIACSG